MKNLSILAGELKSIYAEIEENRDLWESELKPLILKIFKKVKKSIDLNLKIRVIDDIKNLEAIIRTLIVIEPLRFVRKGSICLKGEQKMKKRILFSIRFFQQLLGLSQGRSRGRFKELFGLW